MLKLTGQQREINSHRAGREVAFAVARYGKTSTLFRCNVELYNKHFHRQGRILASTFVREANHQIKGKLVPRSSSKVIHALTLGELTSRIVLYGDERESHPAPIEADSGISW